MFDVIAGLLFSHHETSCHFRNLLPATTGSEIRDSENYVSSVEWSFVAVGREWEWRVREGLGHIAPKQQQFQELLHQFIALNCCWTAWKRRSENSRYWNRRHLMLDWGKGAMLTLGSFDTETDVTGYPEGYCPFHLTWVLLLCIPVVWVLGEAKQN